MPKTPLLPLPDDLEIISIRETENHLEIQILSQRTLCLCPGCSFPSQAIHSYYRRHPMELPCTGRMVRMILSVKKFFCRNPSCKRKVFTERIPELIESSSRLTTRLRTLVQAIGIAFNANGGARLGVQVSRMTVLFSLHLLPIPSVGQIKHVGIDDFAWKRGLRYGTVIIDLDSHRIIDMLPDRETESVKKWLESHPEIEVVSRDRGGAYADGSAQGAPQAIQCADRWHLSKNLGDAVESYLKRQPLSIPAPILPASASAGKETSASVSTYEQRRQERLSQANFERKQEIVEKVREM